MASNHENKFLVFHDIEQRPNGVCTITPRHISLAPPLYLPEFPSYFAKMLDKIAADTEPFEVTSGTKDWFGKNCDREVDIINDPTGNLLRLNRRIVAAIGIYGLGAYMSHEFPIYQPHSTKTAQLPDIPDTIRVTNISYYYKTTHGKNLIQVPFGK